MARYRCSVCGFVYDESVGIPSLGVAPGTAFSDMPDGSVCPVCWAPPEAFELIDEEQRQDIS